MMIKTLEDLFIHELSDMHNAERQLTKALPKMVKAASDEALAECFETHLSETFGQIDILDEVVSVCDIRLKREKCDAMEGLITEAEEILANVESGPVLDAALITAAQKVEHYEIAGYGTLVQLAKDLGWTRAASLLQTILDQEQSADTKLNMLAKGGINKHARFPMAA